MTQVYEVQTIEAFGMPYTESRYSPEPVDLEVPIITIEFKPDPQNDYCYDQPKFVFLDEVVLRDKWEYCLMHQLDFDEELDIFRIIGMKLVESRSKSGRLTEAPNWLYEIECLTSSKKAIWIDEEELIGKRDLKLNWVEF